MSTLSSASASVKLISLPSNRLMAVTSPVIPLILISIASLLAIDSKWWWLLTPPVEEVMSAPLEEPVAEGEQVSGRSAGPWSLPNRPSLFNIIRFPNEECFDSSNQSGTCYTAFECKLIGGQPSSPCAAGFGSCCIVSRTCHVTTREKVVYFKNPSYPSADTEERFCDLTMEIDDPNVCQLRIDFLDFQLDQPTNGACNDDYLEISASGLSPQTVPRLCGLNRNQHLYISVPQDFGERSASIVFYTDAVGDHRWQLKITQIDCQLRRFGHHLAGKAAKSPLLASKYQGPGYHKYSTTFTSGFNAMTQTASALAYEMLRSQFTPRAPNGCLQYFTAPSGIIESFNFGHYLNNMDYSICIQRQSETCRIVFTSTDYDWSINGVGVSSSTSGVGDSDCARDYLMIPGASRNGDGFTYDRYCGGRLNYYRGQTLSAPVVIKTQGPIVLRFHSDSSYETVNSGGFRLQYEQSNQDCIYHSAEEAGSLASGQFIVSTFSDSRPLPAASQLSHNEISANKPALVSETQTLFYSPAISSLTGSNQVINDTSPIITNTAELSDQSSNSASSSNGPPTNSTITIMAHLLGSQGEEQQVGTSPTSGEQVAAASIIGDQATDSETGHKLDELLNGPGYEQPPGESLLLWRSSINGLTDRSSGGGQVVKMLIEGIKNSINNNSTTDNREPTPTNSMTSEWTNNSKRNSS